MAHRDVPEHSVHQRVQIGSPCDAWQVLGEVRFKLGEILPVMIRLVEPIAHYPPGLPVHLLPLGPRVDRDFHLGEIEFSFVRVWLVLASNNRGQALADRLCGVRCRQSQHARSKAPRWLLLPGWVACSEEPETARRSAR